MDVTKGACGWLLAALALVACGGDDASSTSSVVAVESLQDALRGADIVSTTTSTASPHPAGITTGLQAVGAAKPFDTKPNQRSPMPTTKDESVGDMMSS